MTTDTNLFDALWSAPYSKRGWLSFTRHGDGVLLHGLDHKPVTVVATGNTPGLGTVLTLHEEGGQYWAGRGMSPGYAPATTYSVLIAPAMRGGVIDPSMWRYVTLTAQADVKLSAQARQTKTTIAHQYLTGATS